VNVTEDGVIGEVERLTYHDPQTAFTVAKLIPPGKGKEVTIVGHLPFIQIGQTIRCHGSWVIDPRHGRQFSVEKFTYELPSAPESIEKMLASGYIKGCGPVMAKKLVKQFGEKTLEVLDQTPEKLFTIEGLGEKRAKRIISSWQDRTRLQELLVLLSSWGISHTLASKIFNRFGTEAVKIIKSNPYRLARDVSGIGFQIADKIADKLGIPPTSPERIDAAITYFLWEFAGDGHTCVPSDVFLATCAEKLGVGSPLVEERVQEIGRQKVIALLEKDEEKPAQIALKELFYSEQQIARHINRLLKSPSAIRAVHVEKALEWAEEKTSMKFAEKQREAIALALQEKVCVVTGGPGTGKSTITKAIVGILSKLTTKIVLIAPTGRAAKRLQEMTGRYSQTIHRLLKFQPLTGTFFHDRSNPLPCDLVVADEVSMMDTLLSHALLEALPDHARIVFVGDVDQLPSIGPGNVLKDFIESGKIPTVKLLEIFRQARHSKIIDNAHRINRGYMPELKTEPDSDFVFIAENEPDKIRAHVLNLVTKRLPEQLGFDSKKDIQVMAPMRKGDCGIEQINADLQAYFSQHGSPARFGRFLVGDKVIQMKNNYTKEVFNGDVGFVTSIDGEEEIIHVSFDDRNVEYSVAELEDLALAWAVSVHKYQGSECPCVVIPIHTQHFKLLNRNLLYTAVTRGKKMVVLVGSTKAIAIAVHQETKEQRWTYLKKLLLSQ
jgi:exodeoxyribonuclease V alpha subunit